MDVQNRMTMWRRLNNLSKLPLECDGMTRVASFVLAEAGVPHTAKVGSVYRDREPIASPHYWIELHEDRSILDYRAQGWAADEDGLFFPEWLEPGLAYVGDEVDVSIPRLVFEALTRDTSHLEEWCRTVVSP